MQRKAILEMKSGSPPRTKEPTVSVAHLAAAIGTAAAIDFRQKEQICDRIHAEQPNLLASVLALPRLRVSMQTVDILLNALIVLTLSVDKSGQRLTTVTEVDQERELERLVATMRFSKGLDASSMAKSIQQTTAYRHESCLLSYVVDTLRRAGLTEAKDEAAKYFILAAINIVNCIATAKRLRS